MKNPADLTDDEFISALDTMSENELFTTMRDLEVVSEQDGYVSDSNNLFSRIVWTESEIERRFPRQLLLPYKEWKEMNPN